MASADQDSPPQTIQYEEILLALGQVSGTTFRLEGLPGYLIRLLVETMPKADAGIVYLYDQRHGQLTVEASHGYRNSVKYSLRLKEGAVGQCYTLRKPLVFASAEAIREQVATLRPSSLGAHEKMRGELPQALSMITLPLMIREKVLGVILLEHYKQHPPFTDANIPLLEALGNWLSLIISNVQSHLELEQNKRSYRELLGKFITTNEEERRKIAREIHDEVNQLLVSVMLNLENVESTLPAALIKVRKRLRENRAHIEQVFDDLRDLSHRLRPPALDDLGLPQALEWYINNLSKEARLPITMEVKGLGQRRPAPIVEMEIFRIAQEALSNVIKHSQATSARIKLTFSKSQLSLLVEDNGKGFDTGVPPDISGGEWNLGLLGMEERAKLCGGTLDIDSSPRSGTRIRVDIPISSYNWGIY